MALRAVVPEPERQNRDPEMEQYKVLVANGQAFAPRQDTLQDIPVIQLDIRKEGLDKRFAQVTKRRVVRARAIAPGCYYNVPITPFPNPSNPPCGYGSFPRYGYSHHILELVDTEQGEGVRVQLLIKDFDVYLMGLRRMRDQKWSPWYYFRDLTLPPFLSANSEKLPIDGGHSERYPIGGHKSFAYVFTELGEYPEKLGKIAFKEPALIAVILFCEAFRDRWMYVEVSKRIKYDFDPMPLGYNMIDGTTGEMKYLDPEVVWARIHSWSKFSRLCIGAGTNEGKFNARKELVGFDDWYGLKCFTEMIGKEKGHLLVLMRDDHYLAPSENDLNKPGAGKNIPNPDFDNLGTDLPLQTYGP